MTDIAFEHELRTVLSHLAPADVPPSLRMRLDALPAQPPSRLAALLGRLTGSGPWFDRLAASAVTGVAVVMLVVLVSILVVSTRPPTHSIGPGSGERAHAWGTQLAALEADDVTIEAGSRTFHAPERAAVISDPGNANYRTLEFSWIEQGVEMRLNIYFAADNANWAVTQIRTYDGNEPGDWIYYLAPDLRAAHGASWEGNVDLMGVGVRGYGRLRIEGLRLTAFAAGTIPRPLEGCRAVGPVPLNPLAPVMSEINPAIPGVAIFAGMRASDAEAMLREQGICYQFRLEFPAENQGQIWCVAPPGGIREWAFDSMSGEVILFVEAGPRETLPPNPPQVVRC